MRALRARQFPEDAGPLAHPVRPSSYMKIDNFYTATIYEKGAEVIRMLKTLLGDDDFPRAAWTSISSAGTATPPRSRPSSQCFADVSGQDLTRLLRLVRTGRHAAR